LIHLRDDELVDVEQLGEPLLWQVGLQPAIGPSPASSLEVRLGLPVTPLAHQLDGFEHARDGARGERSRVHQEVRRRQIVAQQWWRLAVGARHGDVQHAAGAIEGLEKGDVAADEFGDRLLQNRRVEQVVRRLHVLPPAAQVPLDRSAELAVVALRLRRPRKRAARLVREKVVGRRLGQVGAGLATSQPEKSEVAQQVDCAAIGKQARDLLVVLHANRGRDDGASRGAADNAREQALAMERGDDAQVLDAKRRAA
jgi:hypothetical protein